MPVSILSAACWAISAPWSHVGGAAWYPSGSYLNTSLAYRLGNRTGTSDTLVIGGQTWSPNEDFSSKTTSYILSANNAALTSNPVSLVNISLEEYPSSASPAGCRTAQV
ncbi:hypothetical protein [Xanthobacter wiegelii]|uniref:hypothetical protein n=1 Tax=Xanthobacter wiegelii TaxID=3119913 RepID=UPI00372875FD